MCDYFYLSLLLRDRLWKSAFSDHDDGDDDEATQKKMEYIHNPNRKFFFIRSRNT